MSAPRIIPSSAAAAVAAVPYQSQHPQHPATASRPSPSPSSGGICDLLQRSPPDSAINLVVPPEALPEALDEKQFSSFTFAPVVHCSQEQEQQQQQSSHSLQQQSRCQNNNLLSSSPRRHPSTDLTNSIPEEYDESASELSPNEPITPVSDRQSQDFNTRSSTEAEEEQIHGNLLSAAHSEAIAVTKAGLVGTHISQHKVAERTATPAPTPPLQPAQLQAPTEINPKSLTTNNINLGCDQLPPPRRFTNPFSSSNLGGLTRASSSWSLRRMSSFSLFKRSNSNATDIPAHEFRDSVAPSYNGSSIDSTTNGSSPLKLTPSSTRRFSLHRLSLATTGSNSPPSPSFLGEMAPMSKENAAHATVPTSGDFLSNKQKNRRSTGFSLRGKNRGVMFTGMSRRRTRSVERKKPKDGDLDLTRQPWAIPPDAGTGMKARRLSISLPDDFTIDVAELLKEYEYQHKLLGRHAKHLGKGATSKVTLMARKGSPGELYAVKEFRSKNSHETTEDYENKIKSEYSIAKSLHHPNIVETIRLCSHHGRWNHVMEYCAEGDLFSLVSKKYLKDESRETDRLCLFKQLIQGINYLHSNGIAHRDIKLENLLITKDSKLKITDFGVSEVFCGIHPGLREAGGQCGKGMNTSEIRRCKPGICGSLPYIAPEVLRKDADYDPRALDVWSAAIVMIYLIFGANLWEKAEFNPASKVQQNYNILVKGWEKVNAKRKEDPKLHKDLYPRVEAFEAFVKPVALRRLLLNMLNPDPDERISISEVISHRWMKNVECCQLESYEDPVKLIDASKKDCLKSLSGSKIYCHSHLPLQVTSRGLPAMPGKDGY